MPARWPRSFVCFVAFALARASAFATNPVSPPTCRSWAEQTNRAADRLPESRWRDVIVRSLGRSCSAIPAPLRLAAGRLGSTKDASQDAIALAKATNEVLGDACVVQSPSDDARAIAARCPLPPDQPFKLDESMLLDIRAGDYAVLNVLLKSLKEAKQYDEATERVLQNFTLSAQILGESARKRGARRGSAGGSSSGAPGPRLPGRR
jgi:hypothetical protein